MEYIEEKEQQLLGIMLGIVVEVRENGAQHRAGPHGGAAGASSHPHLLQQADKYLSHPALRPALRVVMNSI